MSRPPNTQMPSEMAGTTSTTITIDAPDTTQSQQQETVQLKLRKLQVDRKVQWSTETVDNEHMDKRKSKCCCIYKKTLAFGESSSEESSDDEDNCDHHSHKKKKQPSSESDSGDCPSDSKSKPIISEDASA